MKKRYVCFTCYGFHPEMKGVIEKEFLGGDNVCKEEKCKFKGKILEEADLCEKCDKLFRVTDHHSH